jgi:hypothetical protein
MEIEKGKWKPNRDEMRQGKRSIGLWRYCPFLLTALSKIKRNIRESRNKKHNKNIVTFIKIQPFFSLWTKEKTRRIQNL